MIDYGNKRILIEMLPANPPFHRLCGEDLVSLVCNTVIYRTIFPILSIKR